MSIQAISEPKKNNKNFVSEKQIKRNRVAEILESLGLDPFKAVPQEKYKALGFNHKTWAMMLRNEIEMTVSQATAVHGWLSGFIDTEKVSMWESNLELLE